MLKDKNRTPIQAFNDGVLAVYAVDRDGDGNESLRVKHRLLRYDERTVGLSRFYKAKQENVEISLVLRIQRHEDISTQDVAVLATGRQYSIRQVQYPKDVAPPCCDMSLERVTHDYDYIPDEHIETIRARDRFGRVLYDRLGRKLFERR